MAKDDSNDLEAILRGDDEDDFESYLNRKVQECSKELPASQLKEILPVAQMTPTPAADAVDTSTSTSNTPTDAIVEPSSSASAGDADDDALLDKADRLKRDKAREAARVREALDAGERRRKALTDVPEEERAAMLAKLVEEESARLEADRVQHLPEAKQRETISEVKAHPITGVYVEERSEIVDYDEEMKNLYFGTFITCYDDNLDYEQAKQNVKDIITHQHKLTRGIQLSKVILAAEGAAKFKLLRMLSQADLVEMQELDKMEREKYSKRKKSSDPNAPKAPRKPSTSKGKTNAQKIADTYKKLGYTIDGIIRKLKENNEYSEGAEAYARSLFKG